MDTNTSYGERLEWWVDSGDARERAGAEPLREHAFLGIGWSFPPTFSMPTRTVVMVSYEADIRESLHILFSTAKGERLMVPTYGCDLNLLVFSSINSSFITEVSDCIEQAIIDWEPRIDVEQVEVKVPDVLGGHVDIVVDYRIRATNSRSNIVYPFYLQEGTLVTNSQQ